MSRRTGPLLLDALLLAVRVKFHEDQVSPGVVFSNLGKGVIYASVRRYKSFGEAMQSGGSIVCSARASTSHAALLQLAQRFHERNAPPPVQDAFEKLKGALT